MKIIDIIAKFRQLYPESIPEGEAYDSALYDLIVLLRDLPQETKAPAGYIRDLPDSFTHKLFSGALKLRAMLPGIPSEAALNAATDILYGQTINFLTVNVAPLPIQMTKLILRENLLSLVSYAHGLDLSVIIPESLGAIVAPSVAADTAVKMVDVMDKVNLPSLRRACVEVRAAYSVPEYVAPPIRPDEITPEEGEEGEI